MTTGFTGVPYDPAQHYGQYGVANINPRGKHILDRRDLYFKDGTSDKVYIVITSQLTPGSSDYFVDAFYGRRGNNMNYQPKAGVSSVSAASAMATKLITEKKSKGYVDYVQGVPNTVKGQQVQSANLKPSSTFPPGDIKWPEYYPLGVGGGNKITANNVIDDTLYILEDALNGPRVFLNVYDTLQTNSTIMAMNVDGSTVDVGIALGHIISFLRTFSINKNFILDGHLMHEDPALCTPDAILKILTHGSVSDRGKLYIKAVDLPFYGNNYLTNLEWKDRRAAMTGLFNDIKKVLKASSWNVYDDFTTHPIVMHKYAFLKKEEFASGKNEMVGKHLRGKYVAAFRMQTHEAKDKWLRWKVGAKRGK